MSTRGKKPAVNLWLFDVREDAQGRQGDVRDIRDASGRVVARQPPIRKYELSYLVSAWADDAATEHRLLGAVLASAPDRDYLPPDILRGELIEWEMPVAVRIAPPERIAGHWDLWGALGVAPRSSVDLRVTAPFVPELDHRNCRPGRAVRPRHGPAGTPARRPDPDRDGHTADHQTVVPKPRSTSLRETHVGPHRVVRATRSVEAVAADRPFRIRYRGSNGGDETTSGHWDHVAILDRTGSVQYEDWHKEGPLAPGDAYDAFVDVGIALDRGSYLVWVTLDGGGRAPVRSAEPMAIGDGRSRLDRAPDRGRRAAGTARAGADGRPVPRLLYGHQRRRRAIERALRPSGGRRAADLWEGWHAVGPLDPADRYDAVVDVPGLAAGDYRLEWTLDWALNHPMAEPDPAADHAHGETVFAVDAPRIPATRPA